MSEFDVLVDVPSTGGLRHQELADRVIRSRSGLKRMVHPLIDRGLVIRHRFDSDRRGVQVLIENGR